MRRACLVLVAVVLTLVGVSPLTATASSATTTLNVVHGIPGLYVDVCVDGLRRIVGFSPGNVESDITLAAGRHRFEVVAEGADRCRDAVLAETFRFRAGRNYTVIANLRPSGTPNLAKFRNDVSPPDAGEAVLLIRHTAAAGRVNVWANDTKLIGGSWFDWGSRARREVPAGEYVVKVTRPHRTNAIIGPSRVTLVEGTVYQAYAWGSADAGYSLAIVPTAV